MAQVHRLLRHVRKFRGAAEQARIYIWRDHTHRCLTRSTLRGWTGAKVRVGVGVGVELVETDLGLHQPQRQQPHVAITGARQLGAAFRFDAAPPQTLHFFDVGAGVGKLVAQMFIEFPAVNRSKPKTSLSSRTLIQASALNPNRNRPCPYAYR